MPCLEVGLAQCTVYIGNPAGSSYQKDGRDQSAVTVISPTTFQKDGPEIRKADLTSVLFVECTPGGVYAARLREAEKQLADITNNKVKIVEKAGTTMKDLLVAADPWEGGHC